MKKVLVKATLWYILSSMVLGTILAAAENLSEGKDIFGREKKKGGTFVDYNGNIHLGTDDYNVE